MQQWVQASFTLSRNTPNTPNLVERVQQMASDEMLCAYDTTRNTSILEVFLVPDRLKLLQRVWRDSHWGLRGGKLVRSLSGLLSPPENSKLSSFGTIATGAQTSTSSVPLLLASEQVRLYTQAGWETLWKGISQVWEFCQQTWNKTDTAALELKNLK